jgi:hypothetical protein
MTGLLVTHASRQDGQGSAWEAPGKRFCLPGSPQAGCLARPATGRAGRGVGKCRRPSNLPQAHRPWSTSLTVETCEQPSESISATGRNACLMGACSAADAPNFAMSRLACAQLVVRTCFLGRNRDRFLVEIRRLPIVLCFRSASAAGRMPPCKDLVTSAATSYPDRPDSSPSTPARGSPHVSKSSSSAA